MASSDCRTVAGSVGQGVIEGGCPQGRRRLDNALKWILPREAVSSMERAPPPDTPIETYRRARPAVPRPMHISGRLRRDGSALPSCLNSSPQVIRSSGSLR